MVKSSGAQRFSYGKAEMLMNQKAHDFLKAGDVLARRYVVLRPLREEPCGGVWLAQDRSLGMDVGLKFMPRHVPQFEAAREALRREGALAFKLRHPYILQVLHFEEGDEGAYLIQEPFLGESLLAHLNRLERFRLPYALNLLEQVAEALAFAHLNHEVHQSLDPASVLFEDHTVKLANFACPRGEGEEEQQVTHLELKAYTAPEVIEGEEVSPAANVFSLGVVGFRLSAGSLPYALTFDEPFPYRLESIPVDLEEIPLPLQNLLLQCLAPDPRDRFEDAGVFLAALEQRRESWRTSSRVRWFSWNLEGQRASGVMASISRTWGQFLEGSKNAAGRITEGFKDLKAEGKMDISRWWLIGLVGVVLALIILIWAGRTLLQSSDRTPQAPLTPAPVASREATPPQKEGPPPSAATKPAAAPRHSALSTSKATPAGPTKKAGATKPAKAQEDRYQLLVVTYLSYDEARAMKKRIRAKGLPSMVYRVTVKNKPYYVVKAGPFSDKKRAEKVARRLEREEHLGQTPKIVTLKAAALKTPPR
jgi:serine/threonine protein kinase